MACSKPVIGETKLKEPRIVTFGFRTLKIHEKNDKKWQAECRTCKSVIVEARGTTSGFVRYGIGISKLIIKQAQPVCG